MTSTHPFQRRAAAFGLIAALASTFGQSIFIGLFGAQVQSELALTPSQWGALYGLATGASGMLMFWLGAMADRTAPARAISLALSILGIGAISLALARGPLMLALAFFCLRLGGQGLCAHLAIVTAARHARLRGRNIAVAASGFILGEALLPLVVTALLGLTGWRWVWACAAALVVLVGLPTLRRIAAPLPQALPVPADSAREDTMRRRDLLRRPAFIAALPVVLLFPFVVTAIFVQQGSISALRGWTPAQVAVAYLCFAGSQAMATWLAGRLVDRVGSLRLLRFYLLPLATGVVLGAFAPPGWAVWGLYLSLGTASGFQSVVSGALWAELFGVHRMGMVRGVATALMVLSTAVSPPLLGWALQNGVPLTALASAVAAFATGVPWIVARWVRVAPLAAAGA